MLGGVGDLGSSSNPKKKLEVANQKKKSFHFPIFVMTKKDIPHPNHELKHDRFRASHFRLHLD